MKKAKNKSKGNSPVETRPSKEKNTKAAEKQQQHFEDDGMDFGGLPDRDLKKNLGGCG